MVLNIQTVETEKDGFGTDALKYIEEVKRTLSNNIKDFGLYYIES